MLLAMRVDLNVNPKRKPQTLNLVQVGLIRRLLGPVPVLGSIVGVMLDVSSPYTHARAHTHTAIVGVALDVSSPCTCTHTHTHARTYTNALAYM